MQTLFINSATVNTRNRRNVTERHCRQSANSASTRFQIGRYERKRIRHPENSDQARWSRVSGAVSRWNKLRPLRLDNRSNTTRRLIFFNTVFGRQSSRIRLQWAIGLLFIFVHLCGTLMYRRKLLAVNRSNVMTITGEVPRHLMTRPEHVTDSS